VQYLKFTAGGAGDRVTESREHRERGGGYGEDVKQSWKPEERK